MFEIVSDLPIERRLMSDLSLPRAVKVEGLNTYKVYISVETNFNQVFNYK